MPDIKTGVIAWYRPDPRAIIPLDGFHTSKSLSRLIHKKLFQITYNQSFPQVLQECANRKQTWINRQFIETYTQLHKDGFAQSIEVWHQRKLVGGLYGIQLARAFFAESMFYKVSNSSKVALYYLVQKLREKNFLLLECQFMTEHLKRLGAVEIYDRDYMRLLKKALQT
jgi:leucyl/phenylalanyl-tRNA--protein transferase